MEKDNDMTILEDNIGNDNNIRLDGRGDLVDEDNITRHELSLSASDLLPLPQQQQQQHGEDDHVLSSTPTRRSSSNDRLTSIARSAVRVTKEQFWDSNESGIVAAQIAVDRWEETYVWFRNFVVASSRSVAGIYEASKTGARGIDQGFLIPIRDYMLLPAFGVTEHAVSKTSLFLNSPEADHIQTLIIEGSSEFVSRTVPFGLGERIILPLMQLNADAIRTVFDVVRYPVPSQRRVRDTVDFLLNGSKHNLSFLGNEIFWYIRRADASLVRSVHRTQWTVLGSGPYETLDLAGRRNVMDHICERYLSIGGIDNDNDDNDNDDDIDDTNNNVILDYTTMNDVARYEFINNVRACNIHLYDDLVGTGLLKKRGGRSTKMDEWLSSRPKYRRRFRNANLYLLGEVHDVKDDCKEEKNNAYNGHITTFALWFRLPCENGQRPKRDVPWIAFSEKDRKMLEEKYRFILQQRSNATAAASSMSEQELSHQQQERSSAQDDEESWEVPKYVTNAKWYNPDLKQDVLLDQKRHAVTFVDCCPKCRKVGELCRECRKHDREDETLDEDHSSWTVDFLLAPPPPLVGLYRPTMWRFYGPDEILRAVWFIDTPRNGPQPYEEEAQAILEDAYHFLRSIRENRSSCHPHCDDNDDEYNDNDVIGKDGVNENVLLTVQVPHNGEQQLVQFSSLTMVTTISKGLGGAISLFKQRIYRGAYNVPRDDDFGISEGKNIPAPVEEERWTTTTEDALEKLKLTTIFESIVGETFEKQNTEFDCVEPLEARDQEEKLLDQTTQSLSDHSECFRNPPKTQSKDHMHHDQSPLAFPVESTNNNSNLVIGEGIDGDVTEADHLCLVVHGIGEMMQSFDLFGLKKVATIVDCCGYLRDNHAEILNARFIQMSQVINGIKENCKSGNVEYLPVEWHEALSLTKGKPSPYKNTRPSNVTIDDISLRTIPNLRSFANDTLMDILYFMSPEHYDVIIDIVVFELNFIVERYRKLTGFEGKISIIGHSIGSIITWDILDNQNDSFAPSSKIQTEAVLSRDDDSYQYPQLNFQVDFVFMLGSPIPVFLMIRDQREPLSSTFTLSGCSKVFNIFHPYDPVSYRIEPLLHPRNSEIEPKIMTHWNGGYRFQYQTKRFWKKLVDQTLRVEENLIQRLESSIEALGLVDSTFRKNPSNDKINGDLSNRESSHKLITGSLNGGRRIDYMLQEKEIDRANEYVAALAAHSCYWLEKDLSLFIANEICTNEG